MVPLFGAAYATPNKGTTILYRLRSPKTLLNPPINGKIHGHFKAFECFSSTFQGKFNLQGLFKTVLYIQVLFKPVRTLASYANLQGKIAIIFLSIILNQTRNQKVIILIGTLYTPQSTQFVLGAF